MIVNEFIKREKKDDSGEIIESKVKIIEVEETDGKIPITSGIEIVSPYIKFDREDIKTYVIIQENHEEIKESNGSNTTDTVISADFAYGKIDFDKIKSNEELCQRYLKYALSRTEIDTEVKKRCGLLPQTVVGDDLNPEYDDSLVKDVMDGVLKASHRTVFKKLEDKEEAESSGSGKLTFSAVMGTTKKKKSIKEAMETKEDKAYERYLAKEALKEQRRKERAMKRGEYVEPEEKKLATEASLDADVLAVFYNSGLIICKDEISDGKPIPRYNICFRLIGDVDKKTLPVRSFLMSDIDEEKLKLEGTYREKFVNDICLKLLETDEEELPERFDIRWPYLGAFSEDSKVGVADSGEKQKYFRKLNRVKKDNVQMRIRNDSQEL